MQKVGDPRGRHTHQSGRRRDGAREPPRGRRVERVEQRLVMASAPDHQPNGGVARAEDGGPARRDGGRDTGPRQPPLRAGQRVRLPRRKDAAARDVASRDADGHDGPCRARQLGAVRGISAPVRHARRAWHRRAVRLHAYLCRALRRPPGSEPHTTTGGGGAHACGDGGGGGRDAGGAEGSGEVAGRVRVLWGACGLRCARRRALRRRTPRRRALRLHARRGTARSYASGSSFQVPSGRHASALCLFCQLPDSEPRVWRRRASTALPLMATTSSGRGGCAVRRASLWCLPLRPLPGVGGGVIACS
mmetsp:Transcript_36321/g.120250  ORF Transcript_36321/g.120250 Transcript_36321/m.120250 type:complete len:305 (+) Transcript_36321:335-1249(+)